MGEHEVQQAVQAIAADEELRAAVAGGDLAGLDGELSEEEQAMVIAAAADFPEVAGFAFDLGFAKPIKMSCDGGSKADGLVSCAIKCTMGGATEPKPTR
jgi:hypothetical protein